MGVGGSFDVYAGRLRRAPLWMQVPVSSAVSLCPGAGSHVAALSVRQRRVCALDRRGAAVADAPGGSDQRRLCERPGRKGETLRDEAAVKLMHVVGARPNFMKVAPVMAAVDAWNAAPHGDVRFEQISCTRGNTTTLP